MDPLPRTTDRLLEHQQFLRSLARGLAGDEAAADDLVQDTLTVALERGPAEGASRPWLTTVLRRLAFNRRRDGARRRERERRAARPEAVAHDAPALDRRLDVQALLSERLRALPTEQRHALVLRYGDGLSPRAIARLVDAPEATVKTRLRRGLARLRTDLDARYSREAWSLALLPDAAPHAGAAPDATRGAEGRPAQPAASPATVSAVRAVAALGLVLLVGGALVAALRPRAADPGAARPLASGVQGAASEVTALAALDAAPRRPTGGEATSVETASAPRVTEEVPPTPGDTHGTQAIAAQARIEREAPRLATRFADAAAPAAYLRVTFIGDADDVLAGRLWFESADFERRRDVELRARGGAVERQTDMTVPARADVTVGAVVAGFVVEPVAVRAAGPGEWTDVTLVLAPDPELAWLTLLLDLDAGVQDATALEGERWLLAVHSGGEALEMPLRSPTVRGGRLDVGGVEPGPITVRGVPLDAANSGALDSLVLLARADLVRGERAEVRAQVSPGGSFRIEALGADGERLGGRVEVERQGARWPVRLRSERRWGPGFDADGTSVIVPPLAPGPAVLHVICEGHRAAAVDVVVRSGEVQRAVVRLDPD